MFPPNQTTGAQVTGAEDDFSSFVRQAVAEEMAKAQSNSQDPTQQGAPAQIPVTINGQTFNFSNPGEVSSAFQQTVSQYTAEIERLKAAQVTAASTPTGAQVTGASDEPEFNIGKFVDFMTTDPRKAFDYVDEMRYGKGHTEAIKGAIASTEKVGQMQQALDVYRFRDNHPEFQANPQNAAIIQNVISQAALNPDYNGLEAAYAIAQTRGLLPHQGQQGQQNQQGNIGQASNYGYPNQSMGNSQFNPGQPQQSQFNFQGAPPPRVSRQAAPPADDFAAMAESMTPEQIEGIFARFQS